MNFNGDKLRKMRIESGYEIDDFLFELYLSTKFRTSRQTLSKWESGKGSPSGKSIYALCKHFNKPVEYFFDKN